MNNNASTNNALNDQSQAYVKEQSNSAKDAIKTYLDNRATNDHQFAMTYSKPNKSIDECFRYILGEARKRGSLVCMTDEEVFGLAVHYYDEDDIKVVASTNFRASTTCKPAQTVELTEEEKAVAREAAIRRYEDLCMAEEAERVAKRKKTEAERKKAKAEQKRLKQQVASSPSLFDFDEL